MKCRVHKLVADVALLVNGRALLVRYADVRRYDGQRGWFLPDDHLDVGEHPDDAARRILHDQVGVDVADVRLDHVESFGDGAWHLIFHYAAEPATEPAVAAGTNVAAAAWFRLDALPPAADMAHDGWAAEVLAKIRPPAGRA